MSVSWPSWSAAPSTTGAWSTRGHGRGDGGLDGPAREAAADEVLRAAGIHPGDPSLYPRTLEDVFPSARAADPRRTAGRCEPSSAHHRRARHHGPAPRRLRRPDLRAPGPRRCDVPGGQFATFPLPDDIGDFGSGAVTFMGPADVFATLFEYGPESVGTALFARQGRPTGFTEADFSPMTLRRGIPGQSGTQWFFTEVGRPFSFYAVLGSHALRAALVPRVNTLLDSLTVSPAVSDLPPARPQWN